MTDRTIPPVCPSCGGIMLVVKLECPSCGAEVAGDFDLCPVCTLDPKTREIFDLFLEARGNVKQVQRKLGVSYPTARSRIEEMFEKLGLGAIPRDPGSILRKLREGEIDVGTAEKLLRGDN
ncbi:DUF2089 domain-containing protein [Candidatus Fermentibacterales bacterium]|nr:DUF2089 domain-containing protein [Candidatus Fermentibacterales bacterium]